MSQDKATIHKLYAVPTANEEDSFERDFRESLEFREEPEACPKCYGSGMEIVAGKGARPCECRRQTSKTNPVEKAKLPRRYIKCDFENYIPSNETQRNAVWIARKLAHEFHPGYEDKGLIFVGNVGVGKTHLAVSVLREITKKGISCLFYEFGALLKEIQNSWNPISQTSELKVLQQIFDAEVLVLDEIGASKPTEWVRDTMAHIINTRYNDKKLTIFTTNYLDVRRKEKDETLEDRIGVRLRSRLYEMCKTIHIEGQDYRKTI